MPSSSASTMAGSEPPSRSGVTYRVTRTVLGLSTAAIVTRQRHAPRPPLHCPGLPCATARLQQYVATPAWTSCTAGDGRRHLPDPRPSARRTGRRHARVRARPSGDAGRVTSAIRDALDLNGPLPEAGADAATLLVRPAGPPVRAFALQRAPQVLRLHHRAAGANRHPRRFPGLGAEPERRGLDAVAGRDGDRECRRCAGSRELIGFPDDCGGLLVSGGNMANIVCLLAARAARAGWDVREDGVGGEAGAGWWPTGPRRRTPGSRKRPTCPGSARMRCAGSRQTPTCGWTSPRCGGPIEADVAAGYVPFLVVGHGRIGQHRRSRSPARDCRAVPGAEDLVPRRRRVRRVCGGGPEAPGRLRALRQADSVAVDPHKWLYAPLEAGCALVRDPEHAARRVCLSPAVLPLRRTGHEFRRLRPAELARLPRAEGLAGAAPGGRRRLPADDLRRHPAVAAHGGRRSRRTRSSSC